MNSPEKSPAPRDPSAFAGWGALILGALGLIVGLFTRHWIAWTCVAGCVGYFGGAIVDRAKR